MLEVVRLTEFAERKPAQLSGGQQQRVALARALVNYPKALLLDEPLGALDLKLRQAMQLELKRIQREVGITFVFVTHDQEEALTMSDRIAVMSAGRVEQIGTPTEIYDRPGTVFVAGFIGEANLWPCHVDARANGHADITAFGSSRLRGRATPLRSRGQRHRDGATRARRAQHHATRRSADVGEHDRHRPDVPRPGRSPRPCRTRRLADRRQPHPRRRAATRAAGRQRVGELVGGSVPSSTRSRCTAHR